MQIQKMKTAELITEYNRAAALLNRKKIRAFHTKKIAVQRVEFILQQLAAVQEEATSTPTTDETPVKAPKPKAEPKEPGGVNFLGMRTEIAASESILELKRPNTTLAKLLPLLLEGATEAQLTKVFNNVDADRGRTSKRDERIRIYEAVRRFCYHHGYGTESTATTIKLVTR